MSWPTAGPVRVTGTWAGADRWTGGAAGVSPCGARAAGAEVGPGRPAADLLAARWTGATGATGEGASDERWADGGAVGPAGGGVRVGFDWSAAARRWAGG